MTRNLALTSLALALVAFSAAAFVHTQRLKLEGSPVAGPRFSAKRFSPTCRCATDSVGFSLRLRQPDAIDVTIVDSKERSVRTLANNRSLGKQQASFEWDGRTDTGAVAPNGRYHARLHFRRQDRTIVVPRGVRVDTTPPEVELLGVSLRTLPRSPRTPDRAILVRYRADETSTPTLLVDGRPAIRGGQQPAGEGNLRWDGAIDGKLVPAGEHELALRVRDRAGNLSAPTKGVRVTLRGR